MRGPVERARGDGSYPPLRIRPGERWAPGSVSLAGGAGSHRRVVIQTEEDSRVSAEGMEERKQ